MDADVPVILPSSHHRIGSGEIIVGIWFRRWNTPCRPGSLAPQPVGHPQPHSAGAQSPTDLAGQISREPRRLAQDSRVARDQLWTAIRQYRSRHRPMVWLSGTGLALLLLLGSYLLIPLLLGRFPPTQVLAVLGSLRRHTASISARRISSFQSPSMVRRASFALPLAWSWLA
jgi:hypothetical protein